MILLADARGRSGWQRTTPPDGGVGVRGGSCYAQCPRIVLWDIPKVGLAIAQRLLPFRFPSAFGCGGDTPLPPLQRGVGWYSTPSFVLATLSRPLPQSYGGGVSPLFPPAIKDRRWQAVPPPTPHGGGRNIPPTPIMLALRGSPFRCITRRKISRYGWLEAHYVTPLRSDRLHAPGCPIRRLIGHH